ncbi:hypothetical protein BDV24DRAFT_127537 [Aspergillus arachidicola]|uniref:Uncharacterized protein n=1 Tax=Aspergillus arachidicola TaxID=656916 RepID=A0A5N6YIA8_9EURO|nr:hypothetical protein BDV24DRAFT_127537 [Aspergillus arachidicola]
MHDVLMTATPIKKMGKFPGLSEPTSPLSPFSGLSVFKGLPFGAVYRRSRIWSLG